NAESSSPTGPAFCSTSITWNNGWRDNDRAGLSSSTRRSNGTSWCPYAPRFPLRTRPTSSRKLGFPDVSVRKTSVFTKNPINPSSAASVRPAIRLPRTAPPPPPHHPPKKPSPASPPPPAPPHHAPRNAQTKPKPPPPPPEASQRRAAPGPPQPRSAPETPIAVPASTQADGRARS